MDGVGHRCRLLRNCARFWNTWHPRNWKAWRLGRAALLGIAHSLAKGMEPQDITSKFGSLDEGIPLARERHPQSWCREVFLKMGSISRMGRHGGDVGKEIFCCDGVAVPFREEGKQFGRKVCFSCPCVTPERKRSPAERT